VRRDRDVIGPLCFDRLWRHARHWGNRRAIARGGGFASG